MKLCLAITLFLSLVACRAPAGGGMDYTATADTVALYRQDVLDVLYLADSTTQARVQELATAIERVEEALRMADSGTAASAATRALNLADVIIAELSPESDLRYYVALARIALRHVQAGQPGDVVPPGDSVIAVPQQ